MEMFGGGLQVQSRDLQMFVAILILLLIIKIILIILIILLLIIMILAKSLAAASKFSRGTCGRSGVHEPPERE